MAGLLVFIALFPATFVADGRDNTSKLWQELVLSGKGAYLVKVCDNCKITFYIIKGFNRRLTIKDVQSAGIRFNTFDSVLSFVKSKPADMQLWEATSEMVSNDAGKLKALSVEERKKIYFAKLRKSGEREQIRIVPDRRDNATDAQPPKKSK